MQFSILTCALFNREQYECAEEKIYFANCYLLIKFIFLFIFHALDKFFLRKGNTTE